jgi:uptake hydrogenase large subunit
MMNEKRLIEQIEGEATLHINMGDHGVDFVSISFPHFRGMEALLKGKLPLDALVYTPRVCGICGHSHLMATVRALESALQNQGIAVNVSDKAQSIREITLVLEWIQNHMKWFYLVIYPELSLLHGEELSQALRLKGAYGASLCNKAAAFFSGQWPHSSFMIPGGVSCDPTHLDVIRVEALVDEVITFFEKEMMGTSLDKTLDFSTCKDFNTLSSDIAAFERLLLHENMHEKGFGYDRFIVMGHHKFCQPARLKRTVNYALDPEHITLQPAYAPHAKSYAINATYQGRFHESGPLARAIATDKGLIKNMHRRYKDSSYSRTMARIMEIPQLLLHVKRLLHTLKIQEASYHAPEVAWSTFSGEGQGCVEAPRGALEHKLIIEKGKIASYRIITPTQWNLGSSRANTPGIAQKAMMGSRSSQEAQFIFKSFDVCSVCTTH